MTIEQPASRTQATQQLSGIPFHPRPETGWINDPNGLIQHHGRYHVFFQYSPASAEWGSIHWGHQSSDDLQHWEGHPIALAPDEAYDRDGCWSGCAVATDDGDVIAFYTGVRQTAEQQWDQTICAARSAGPLDSWTKLASNPLVSPPSGPDLVGFRDPFVWQTATGWSMIVGSGVRGQGGCIFRYDSNDLHTWQYSGVFLAEVDVPEAEAWLGTMWECPQLVKTDGGDALVISIHDEHRLLHTMALVGTEEGGRFVVSKASMLDCGHDYYAPAVMRDSDGRWLSWGWSPEARSADEKAGARWSGLLTAPRQLTVDRDRQLLVQRLPRELRDRAAGEVSASRAIPDDGSAVAIPLPAQPALVRLALAGGRSSQVLVRLGDDGNATSLSLAWDRYGHVLIVDREPSAQAVRGAVSVPVDSTEDLELLLLIDDSIVELFTGEGRTATERVYGAASTIHFAAIGGPAELTTLEY